MLIGYRDFSTALEMAIKTDEQKIMNRFLMGYASRKFIANSFNLQKDKLKLLLYPNNLQQNSYE